MYPAALPGLDLLATAVILVDDKLDVTHVNPAAENLFEVSSKNVVGHRLPVVFQDSAMLESACAYARANNSTYTEHDLALATIGHPVQHLSCTVTPVELADNHCLLLEFRDIQQQLRIAREERMLDQSKANRELIRNLAHEINNPLGGIRGAAQLLERELERPALNEYTQVIIKEADRLQSLMDRLLTPHRLPQLSSINVHEATERVRSVLLAEYPHGLELQRDYDTSIPRITGDMEQIIQA